MEKTTQKVIKDVTQFDTSNGLEDDRRIADMYEQGIEYANDGKTAEDIFAEIKAKHAQSQ